MYIPSSNLPHPLSLHHLENVVNERTLFLMDTLKPFDDFKNKQQKCMK